MKLKSQILTSSNSFKQNIKKHLKDIKNIEQIAKTNSLGGPEKSREKREALCRDILLVGSC